MTHCVIVNSGGEVGLRFAGRREGRAAFTLIELMIAICIIGVLASVAIPGYNRFLVEARSTEGPTIMSTLYKGANAYWVRPVTQRGLGSTASGRCVIGEPDMVPGGALLPPLPPVPEKRTADFASNPAYSAVGYTNPDPTYFVVGWGNAGDASMWSDQCGNPDGPVYWFFALSDIDGDNLYGGYNMTVFSRNGQLSKNIGLGGGLPDFGTTLASDICPMCVPYPD
jgi:prepilin-type N-terminal cleavage/methylation domain-containing protein